MGRGPGFGAWSRSSPIRATQIRSTCATPYGGRHEPVRTRTQATRPALFRLRWTTIGVLGMLAAASAVGVRLRHLLKSVPPWHTRPSSPPRRPLPGRSDQSRSVPALWAQTLGRARQGQVILQGRRFTRSIRPVKPLLLKVLAVRCSARRGAPQTTPGRILLKSGNLFRPGLQSGDATLGDVHLCDRILHLDVSGNVYARELRA